jgi:hypothetical protein
VIEVLNDSFLWWHWIVLGMILLILEMNTGTFLMLGLGVSAMVVGVIDILFETSFTVEIFLWMLLSSLSIWAWFKWFKTPAVTQSGQSNYKLDTLGTVMEEIFPHARGKVTFDRPVLGNTSWHSTATIHIPQNTRVQIVQVNGQLIEVEPLKEENKG